MKWHLQYRVDRSSDIQRPGSISTVAEVRWSKVAVPEAVCCPETHPKEQWLG